MILVICGVVLLVGCRGYDGTTGDSSKGSTRPGHKAREIARPLLLPNLLRVSPAIHTGGTPRGQEAFRMLRDMGVRTVISVDAARPEVDAAKSEGLGYVHVPMGYDGVDTRITLSLARIVEEVAPALYIHCHRGKHRGPVAAVIAAMTAGELSRSEAESILHRAGTSPRYGGLWKAVRAWQSPDVGTARPALVEVVDAISLAGAMARIDRAHGRLQACRDAGWITPPGHPDIVPNQEALLLREAMFESRRHLAGDHDRRFGRWLAEAVRDAEALEAALRRGDTETAARRFDTLNRGCTRCHRAYRD